MTDVVQRTQATYDQIAAGYWSKWRNRKNMMPRVAEFARFVPAFSTILDIGCGPASDQPLLEEAGLKTIGIDLSWGMLQAGKAKHGGTFVQADMRHLPIVANSVGGIWANASTLHLPRAEMPATLRQFATLLQPRAPLMISVKVGEREGWFTSWGEDNPRYYSLWTASELDTLLHQAHFNIMAQQSDDNWLYRLLISD